MNYPYNFLCAPFMINYMVIIRLKILDANSHELSKVFRVFKGFKDLKDFRDLRDSKHFLWILFGD